MGKSTSLGLAGLLALSTLLLALTGAVGAAPAPGWSAPLQVEDMAISGYPPAGVALARAPDGSMLAAWSQYTADIGYEHIYFRMFDPASGWSPLTTLVGACGNDANQPSVAAFPNGSFVLVYRDTESGCGGGNAEIMAKRYDTAHGGWQNTEVVSTDAGYADVQTPVVKTDGNGNAIVVYTTNDGANTNLRGTRWTPSGGWPLTTSLLELATYAAYAPALAVDHSGNAIALWRQSDATSISIFANRYVVGSGWGSATEVDTDTHIAYNPVVEMDESGNAEALWTQSNATVSNLYAARFTTGTGWGTPSVVEGWTGYGASSPSLAALPGGTFLAAWHQGNDSGRLNIFASRFDGASWGTPTNITPSAPPQGAFSASVVSDGAGGAVVFYHQYTPAYNWHVWTTWWSLDGGWSAGQQLDTNPLFYANFGKAVFDGSGHGLALFVQSDGNVVHLFASMYMRPDTTPPSLTADAAATTTTPTVVVSGTTEPGATVIVGGIVADVGDTGGFSVPFALKAGANTIVVEAKDAAGNEAYQTVNVTFNDPVPALQTQLAAATSSLASAQDQLARTQADLSTARADLNATKLAQATTDTGQQAKIDAAAGSGGTAMLVGLLALIVGLVAIAMGFMMGRRGMGGEKPAEAKPADAKPAEPPK